MLSHDEIVSLLAGADPESGVAAAFKSARAGDPRACGLAAVIAAAGICRPPSWDEGLDFLQSAAEAGDHHARGQLELLAAWGGAATAGLAPAELRGAIALDRLLSLPTRHTLCESPRLRWFETFASGPACDWLIRRARPLLVPAQVYGRETGTASDDRLRTNHETSFDIGSCDLVLLLMRARIACAAGVPTSVLEVTRVLRYAPGEEFHLHFDFLDPQVPAYSNELAANGQRIATCLVYLNDDYEAGATEFPSIGLSHRGRRGDALLFANVDRAGAPDRSTLHAGRAPVRGEKWVLSQWIRDRTPAGR